MQTAYLWVKHSLAGVMADYGRLLPKRTQIQCNSSLITFDFDSGWVILREKVKGLVQGWG